MKNKFYATGILLLIFSTNYSQSSYFLNPSQCLLSANPSFAGSNQGFRFQAIKDYQEYNSGFFGTNTYSSFDGFIKPINAGVALNYETQLNFPWYSQQSISTIYAQHISLFKGDLKIIPSIGLGYNVIHAKVFNPRSGFSDQTKTSAFSNYKGGILVNIKNFYIGLSKEDNFNLPPEGLTFFGVRSVTNFYMSGNIAIGTKTRLNLSVWHQRQNGSNQVFINENTQMSISAAIENHILLGLGFNSNFSEDPYFNLGYRNDYFTAQASYLRTDKRLAIYAKDKFQVALSVNLRNEEKRKMLTNFETW